MILETPYGTFKGKRKDISDVIKLHDNLIILSFWRNLLTIKTILNARKSMKKHLLESR